MAQREVDAVIAQAREAIAAGRTPNVDALRARLRGDEAGLAQLERVLAIHRARNRLSREVSAPAPKPSLRAALRTKVTVNANMDVRRERAGEAFALVWDAVPSIDTETKKPNKSAIALLLAGAVGLATFWRKRSGDDAPASD